MLIQNGYISKDAHKLPQKRAGVDNHRLHSQPSKPSFTDRKPSSSLARRTVAQESPASLASFEISFTFIPFRPMSPERNCLASSRAGAPFPRFREAIASSAERLTAPVSHRTRGAQISRPMAACSMRKARPGGGAAYAYSEQDPYATGAAWTGGELARLVALGLTKRKAGQLQARVRSGGMSLVPGVPAAPAAAMISSQAATLPWRMEE